MKNSVFIPITVLSALLLFSCFHQQSKKEVVENLKTAMDLYLNHDPRIDSSKVKFTVLEVTYSETPKYYNCNFKVNLKDQTSGIVKDTTGIMVASISRDFKDVSRRN